MQLTLSEIAQLVDGKLIGNPDIRISQLSSLDGIVPGSLVLAESSAHLEQAKNSEAAAVLSTQTIENFTKPLIIVSHAFQAFIQLLNTFYPTSKPKAGIHSNACIGDQVTLGKDIYIGPFVSIGDHSIIGDGAVIHAHVAIGQHVTIGKNTTLHSHVSVYDKSQIGDQVIIHANSVIGSDGFGYKFIEGKHVKVPHNGGVIIEDHVEIGANTVIDRAPFHVTRIGYGTKIDNLVQVAHGVELGKHNILCAFTGVAGSTRTGDRVFFAANVGVSDHVRIDDDVILGARTGVPPKKHLLQGQIYLGNPSRPKDKALEQELSATRIPIMRKNLRNLSETVKALTQRINALENCEE